MEEQRSQRGCIAGRMPAGPSPRAAHLVVAVIVATLAFVVYARSLLPGLDLGDTAAFQAAVLWPIPSVRQSYPLYYTMAAPFVALLSPGDPARGLNLFSAVWGAVAVGLLAWVTTAIGRSVVGGAAAALLLAFSYTFWSQAIIAEVYTLHLAIIGAMLTALHAYSVHPTRARLATFCGVYALGFGNHLSLILWFVPCAALILMAHPAPRQLFRPGVVLMAAGIALAGALQYVPVVVSGWTEVDAPASALERAATVWATVTMSEWRSAMVFGVHVSTLDERLAMWGWDARQQFGAAGLAAALIGGAILWRLSRPWAACLWLAYAGNTTFALTYNVGDPHVFFLPGHYLTALSAGVGVGMLDRAGQAWFGRVRAASLAVATTVAALAIGHAIWRGWSTWPAAERSADRRASQLVAGLTRGLDGQRTVLVSGLNWDQETALQYASRYLTTRLSWTCLDDVLPHAPAFVADNHDIGRDVVLDATAAAAITARHHIEQPLLAEAPLAGSLIEAVARMPPGTPYVLTVLSPIQAFPVDRAELDAALTRLSGGRVTSLADARIFVLSGLSAAPPSVAWTADRPFERDLSLLGDRLSVRIDGWIPVETFRRGGFGHVIAGRERLMFIERGISLLWLAAEGPRVLYAAGPYAHPPLWRIPAARTQLADRGAIPEPYQTPQTR
jgi:hypothetical protein